MGGYWSYHRSRHVQCPICGHDYWSQVETTMCSKCKTRFDGDENQFKTLELIQKDRKQMYGELSDMRTSVKTILDKIDKMQFRLKPFSIKERKPQIQKHEPPSVHTEIIN